MRAWLHILVVLALHLSFSEIANAANRSPRTCAIDPHSIIQQQEITGGGGGGGSGGTGHDPVVPPGGMGGTGIQAATQGGISGTGHSTGVPTDDLSHKGTESTQDGGLGGTGNAPTIPPGGIGGNGIQASGGSGGGDGGIGGTGIQASSSSGMGGTGHSTTVPPGGIGGNGIEASIDGGMGGTGNTTTVPPGGMGGTGITAGVMINSHGTILITNAQNQKFTLETGDAICAGDHISTDFSSQAKIEFTDGAILYALKNTELRIDAYHYSASTSKDNRSQISLIKGDIRSVSGAISKTNPEQYAIKTPVARIDVVGTDFIVTHLDSNEDDLERGTYTKVISGKVNVRSASSKVRLHAGESSHVMMNGTQIILYSHGGTCQAP